MKTKEMKNRLYYGLFMVALLTGLMFVSCSSEKEDEPEPEPTLTVSASFKGGGRPAPATVEFTSTTTLATSVHWDFGDGTESEEANPTHTYAEKGSYDVVLTAFDEAGESRTSTRTVEVWGELAGWIPQNLRFHHEYMAYLADEGKVFLDDYVYLIFRNLDGDMVPYHGDMVSGYILDEDFWENENYLNFDMTNYSSYPMLQNTTLFPELYARLGASANPDTDERVSSSFMILSANMFLPNDDISPYKTTYDYEDWWTFDIQWKEKE